MKFRQWISVGLSSLAARFAGEEDPDSEMKKLYPPDHEFWYTADPNDAVMTGSGVMVSPALSQKLTIANACRRLIYNTGAMLPVRCYQRLGNGRKRLAEEHWLDRILHKRPNSYQTPFEFKAAIYDDLASAGNHYSERVRSRRTGRIEELHPIQHGFVIPDWLDKKSGRQRVYDISSWHDGRARVLSDQEIWHPRLLSLNGGLSGASPIALNAEGIGFSLISQLYAQKFFTQGARLAGFIAAKNEQLTKQQREEAKESIGKRAGIKGFHENLVFSAPMEFHRMSISPRDAQLLDLMSAALGNVARVWGIPLWLLQAEEKDTAWGTGMETMGMGYKTYTIMPYNVCVEESFDMLLVDEEDYFVEVTADALMRADMEARYKSYAIAMNANNPWLVRNEPRRWENLPPDEGPDGERFILPENNVGAAAPQRGQNGQRGTVLVDQYNRQLTLE